MAVTLAVRSEPDCRLRPHWPGSSEASFVVHAACVAPGSSERGGCGARRDERPRAPVLTGTERQLRQELGPVRADREVIGSRRAARLTEVSCRAAFYGCRMELLEREEALAALAEARDDAARGAGRAVLVSGEPGIGKTALVTRFLASLDAGARVLSARATTSRSRAPLGPDPRPRRKRLARARAGARRRRGAARDPDAARGRARAAAAADRARARGRALGRRRDARRDHRGRPADRLAARAARAHLPRRRGAARPPAARDGRRDPRCGRADPRARRRSRRARSPRSPATARTRCTPRPAATRSTSPSCSPPQPSPTLPPSVANTVLGRAARLDDDSRRLVELVSVVPSRMPTSVLDAVMPDWSTPRSSPSAGSCSRSARVRALPPRAGAARDAVERPDRRAAAAARRDPGGPARRGRRSGGHRPPRRGRGRRGRRRRVRARRRAPGGGAGVEPRGVLALPPRARSSSTGSTRPSRRRCSRSWRPRPTPSAGSRTRSPRSSARSRSTARSATTRPSAAARACSRATTGSRATARRAAGGARGDRDPRAARPLARARPRLQRRLAARDAGGGRRAGARVGRARARAGDPARRRATRAHALVNIGSARLNRDGETESLLEAHVVADAAGDRHEAARALDNLGHSLMCWARPDEAMRYAQQAAATARGTSCSSSRRTPPPSSPGCGCARASGTRPSG